MITYESDYKKLTMQITGIGDIKRGSHTMDNPVYTVTNGINILSVDYPCYVCVNYGDNKNQYRFQKLYIWGDRDDYDGEIIKFNYLDTLKQCEEAIAEYNATLAIKGLNTLKEQGFMVELPVEALTVFNSRTWKSGSRNYATREFSAKQGVQRGKALGFNELVPLVNHLWEEGKEKDALIKQLQKEVGKLKGEMEDERLAAEQRLDEMTSDRDNCYKKYHQTKDALSAADKDNGTLQEKFEKLCSRERELETKLFASTKKADCLKSALKQQIEVTQTLAKGD